MEWMFMPLRRYADFSGRSRRMEFWMWQLFQVIVYVVLIVLMMALGGGAMMMVGNDPSRALAAGGPVMLIFALYGIYCLAVIVPSIAVAVRRLHDTDRTGWWVLAPLAPYVLVIISAAMVAGSPDSAGPAGILALVSMLVVLALAIVLLVFYVLDGTPGANRYGPDPKGREAAQVFA